MDNSRYLDLFSDTSLRNTVSRGDCYDRITAEEGGGATIELSLRVEQGTVPGELMMGSLLSTHNTTTSLDATVCGVGQQSSGHRGHL